jgi:hypothetical protein
VTFARGEVSPLLRLGGMPHLDLECTLIKGGEGLESCLGEIDVLGTFGTSGACVDHTYEDALVMTITDFSKQNEKN